ncbi:MAG: hypothetical protein OEN52_11640 [Gammaproteobacteria bacterium]|nr:hypothetical protein [Gammaproteobacteria bacterium]
MDKRASVTSPEIKILLVLASASIGYAFVCEIRLSRMASRVASWLKKECPGLWSELNIVARNWNGGYPALKMLHRRNVVGLPRFDREYAKLLAIERKLFWGVGTGVMCFSALIAGFIFLDWHW